MARAGTGVMAALKDKVQGPFDFAWLLERAADFGGETPPWLGTGARAADFRSDPPPPPLQLMVPETMSLEEGHTKDKGKSAENSVRALFFTDRAGYLRGTRRGLNQGHVLCEAISRLMRHRLPMLTLTHSSTNICFERRVLEHGAKAWTDRQLTYMHVPPEMDRAVFFAGPHTAVPTGELILSSPEEGTAYIWSEDKPESDGGLPGIGWDPLRATMSFGGGRVMKIYWKLMSAGSCAVIPVRYLWVGGVAFQRRPSDDDEGSEVQSPAQTTGRRNSQSSTPGGLLAGGRRLSAATSVDSPRKLKKNCSRTRSPGNGRGSEQAAPTPRAYASSGSNAAPTPRALASSGAQIPPTPRTLTSTAGAAAAALAAGLAAAMTGSWRVCVQSGKKQQFKQFKHEDVAAQLGSSATQWPGGSRWLQACFWDGQKDVKTGMVYHYEALRKECDGTHPGTSQNIVNHFERYSFLDRVADWNLASSAPVLVSQHLSYHCGLELLSGDFEFIRDTFGMLWLVEARNLHVIASARANLGGTGMELASKQDVQKQTLPRYLSEEALRNLPVVEDTGLKCQRMISLMHEHYKTMKVLSGMEDILRKTDEVVEISIPVFEGTDRRAFARTFGGASRTGQNPVAACGINCGLAAAPEGPKRPAAPKQQALVGRGRLGALPPRPSSTPPGAPGRGRGAAGSRACAWEPLLPTPRAEGRAQTPRATIAPPAVPALDAMAPVASSRSVASARSCGTVKSGGDRLQKAKMRGTLSHDSRTTAGSRGGSPGGPQRRQTQRLRRGGDAEGQDEAATIIEIVLPDSAQKLLAHSGPGLRPDGPTLDVCGPLSTRTPGAGLLERRQAARPSVRLVEVPEGIASAALPKVAEANAAQRKLQV